MKKGLIIPIIEKYENILIENIQNLYNNLNFTLPIELWQIGNEISTQASQKLLQLQLKHNIVFKNVQDFTEESLHWKGYQIKAFVVKHTTFDEVILCDCDVVFGTNPEVIFEDENYIKTGSFFFKDYLYHYPKDNEELTNRINYIKKLIPIKNVFFPSEWDYVYTDNFNRKTHSWFYLESGVVYLNKQKHVDVVNTIYDLNYNWIETYKYVHGDKETFWLSFVMNNKPFYINSIPGFNHPLNDSLINCSNRNVILTHTYNNKYFFSQKGYPRIG